MDRPKFETLTFKRDIAAPPAAVFGVFEDAAARKTWALPHPSLNMIFEQEDFRTGGRDICLCGPKGAEDIRVDLLYERIEQDRLIVYTERVGTAFNPQSVAVVTTEFSGESETALKLTVQITAISPNIISGYRDGTRAALDNLQERFA